MTDLERRFITGYPIRYSAFEYPRVFFVAVDTAFATTKNKELGAYYEPTQNSEYPEFMDGLYAEIRNWYSSQYMAEIHATQPWKGRAQKTEHRFFSDFAQAVAWIEGQVPIYRRFCTYRVDKT